MNYSPEVEERIKGLFGANVRISLEQEKKRVGRKNTGEIVVVYVRGESDYGIRFEEPYSFLTGMHEICKLLGAKDGDIIDIDKQVYEHRYSTYTLDTSTTYSMTLKFW